MHKDLYNSAIANRRVQYERYGHSVSYYEQQNSLPAFKEVWIEYKQLGSQTLKATLKRVDLAYQSFFKGLRGKPKFKSIRHYSGWTYPATSGWRVHTTGDNGYLELTDLKVSLRMRGKARTWGKPTTCTIVYRNGKWYASITVECTPVRETSDGAIGIDFGTYHAAALSDGTVIDNPRFQYQSAEKIKIASKQKRRKRAPNLKRRLRHQSDGRKLLGKFLAFSKKCPTRDRIGHIRLLHR
jgi:putative transposase